MSKYDEIAKYKSFFNWRKKDCRTRCIQNKENVKKTYRNQNETSMEYKSRIEDKENFKNKWNGE